MTEQKVYETLIEYLDNPVFPLKDSDHLMPMVTSFFSPEEAAFLTGFPKGSKTLEEIAEIKDMDIGELKKTVKALCAKGVVYESIRRSERRYKLWFTLEIFIRVPYWAGKDEEPFKSTAHHVNKYWADGLMDPARLMKHPELRAIPINETVESPTGFLPYEDILTVVDNYEYCSVSFCPCRVRHRLDPDYEESKFPEEVCLHFNELGRYCVENGLGREITKEETLKILKKAADAGLTHGIANSQENPETICNCDLEYCQYFRRFHHLDFDKSIEPSNYRVEVTPETCIACGMCVKRCPMDALGLKRNDRAANKFKKAVVVDDDLCVGCGVCVHKCKPGSITMVRKQEDQITHSPKTAKDLIMTNVMEVFAALEKQGAKN